MATKLISQQEALVRLQDIDIPDEELAKLLEIDEAQSGPFQPSIRFNPKVVAPSDDEGAMVLGIFNNLCRWRRQKRYKRLIRNWDGIRIVSEGDSWFQYPFLLKDVIDQLSDLNQYQYAIYSLGAAGDHLRNMFIKDEIADAIEREQPHLLLLSGGGNDMVGDARVTTMVSIPTKKNPKPVDYLNKEFLRFVEELRKLYREVFERYLRQQPHLKIIVHGYDYAIPDSGRWLGKPMAKAKITDKSLQRSIVAVMIDRFNQVLIDLQEEFVDSVFHVDVRDEVTDWKDELHPESECFNKVAALFDQTIQKALGHSESDPITLHQTKLTDVRKLTPAAFDSLVYQRAKASIGSTIKPPTTKAERKNLERQVEQFYEKIHNGADFLPVRFLEDGVDRAQSVCQILTNTSMGSGFMLATRQYIMTNNHVLPNRMTAVNSTARFDFDHDSQLFDVRLAPDQLFITNEALDFTIVALAPHNLPQNIQPIEFRRSPGEVTRNERVNIIQHPNGRAKEVSLHDNKVTYVYDKLIRYRADTQPGSSGSPVFNNQWELVALHHQGWSDGAGTATNQGVRMSAIVDFLMGENQSESAALFGSSSMTVSNTLGPSAPNPHNGVKEPNNGPELIIRGNLKGVSLKFE